eukprot:scaffold69078_cov15-Tisochrysis_lutea.AAC.3
MGVVVVVGVMGAEVHTDLHKKGPLGQQAARVTSPGACSAIIAAVKAAAAAVVKKGWARGARPARRSWRAWELGRTWAACWDGGPGGKGKLGRPAGDPFQKLEALGAGVDLGGLLATFSDKNGMGVTLIHSMPEGKC